RRQTVICPTLSPVLQPPPRSPLFPYTTLFRSKRNRAIRRVAGASAWSSREGGARCDMETSAMVTAGWVDYPTIGLRRRNFRLRRGGGPGRNTLRRDAPARGAFGKRRP